MTWTTSADVISAWIGDDVPYNLDSIDIWIARAERLIRFNVPGIQARIDAGEPDLLEAVIDVTTSMVIRKFRNPEGFRTTNETTGPFSRAKTYGGDEPGELTLLDRELAQLSGGAAGGQRAFAIDMIPTTSPFSSEYVPSWPFA